MTEFYKGIVTCTTGQSLYHVSHAYINVNNSYPILTISAPTSTSSLYINAVTNKTSTGFDIILSGTPLILGYEINWLINIPGTDCSEYINDKRYYSKVELANPKLARIHWKNVIAAPDLTPTGLQNNHNHDNRYPTTTTILPIIDSRINLNSSYSMTADTLMVRNEHGRCQVNIPKVSSDAANKGYTDNKFNTASSKIDLETISRVESDNGIWVHVDSISAQQEIIASELHNVAVTTASVSSLGGGEGVTISTPQTINGEKTFSNDIIFSSPSTRTIYFGNPSNDGSWAIGIFGGNFVTSERISGVWVIKNVIS